MKPSDETIRAEIDYDRVYREYLQSLVDTLRGFSTGIDGLELWVPHEDPLLSLRNLLDAAADAGRTELSVRFGPETRPGIDANALGALAASYGRPTLYASERELVVAVVNLRAPVHVPSTQRVERAARSAGAAAATGRVVSEVYDRALAAVEIRHEGPVPVRAGRHVISTTIDGVSLSLLIEPAFHTVCAAGFLDARSGAERALLSKLCEVVVGLPILEAVHHGVGRLEAVLRDRARPRPVAGIVLPRAAHPMFDLPTALLRAALAAYRAETGYAETVSRFFAGPGAAWAGATRVERHAQVRAAIAPWLAARGLELDEVPLRAIEYDVRLVFALPDRLSGQARQRLLLDLDELIKAAIDPRLEIYAEERKDKNKLRRLAVVQPDKEAP